MLADTVFAGKLILEHTARGIPLPHLDDLRAGQLRVVMSIAVADDLRVQDTSRPAFNSHIVRVISMSAKEKMLRADARGIVTSVTDKQPIRNGAIMQFPRQPMGAKITLFPA